MQVTLTANLQKYYPEASFTIEAKTLKELLAKMDAKRPHFSSYILDDEQIIRKHVNIFIDGEVLADKSNILMALKQDCSVHIMQALSGG